MWRMAYKRYTKVKKQYIIRTIEEEIEYKAEPINSYLKAHKSVSIL